MIAAFKSELAKEVTNCAAQLEFSGAAAFSEGAMEAALRPGTRDSIDEVLHAFFRETERTPCPEVLRRITGPILGSEMRVRNAFAMLGACEGSDNPGGVIATFANLSPDPLKGARQAEEISKIRKGESKQGTLIKVAAVVDDVAKFYVSGEKASELAKKVVMYSEVRQHSVHLGPRLEQAFRAAPESFTDLAGIIPSIYFAKALFRLCGGQKVVQTFQDVSKSAGRTLI